MTATRELPPHRALPPPRKPAVPGQPWSHQETIALIDAYKDLWYALKRGQLKAQQWEDVAASVAARCGGAALAPSKSGTQCRHKIEKLRKRYKSERARPPSSPSPWPYFDRMDRMDRGSEGEEEEEDEEDDDEPGNVRSINGILREGFVRAPSPRSESEGERGEVMGELAAVVRRFGEGMVRMEKRRMEMMREVERDWMEMEAKRAEMVLDSQRWLVDRVVGAFESQKKARKCEASSYATTLEHRSGVRNYGFPHDPLV